jgi:hypothetical protein
VLRLRTEEAASTCLTVGACEDCDVCEDCWACEDCGTCEDCVACKDCVACEDCNDCEDWGTVLPFWKMSFCAPSWKLYWLLYPGGSCAGSNMLLLSFWNQ